MNFTKKKKKYRVGAVFVNSDVSSYQLIIILHLCSLHLSHSYSQVCTKLSIILCGSVMRSRWLSVITLAEHHIVHPNFELTFYILTSDTKRNIVAGVSCGPLVKPDALLSIRQENEYVHLFTCSISWTPKPTREDPSVQPGLVPAC